MKLMKKKSLGILALTSLMLVGCGEKKNQQIEVTWWNNYQTPDTSKTEEENRKNKNYFEYYYAQDLIAEFEKAHSNIKIVTSCPGGYNDIADAIKKGMDSGNFPTIASTYQDNVAIYVDNEISNDMTAFAAELEKDSDFNQNYLTIEKGCFNGKYYSLPYIIFSKLERRLKTSALLLPTLVSLVEATSSLVFSNLISCLRRMLSFKRSFFSASNSLTMLAHSS